jgi:hypothetical protein
MAGAMSPERLLVWIVVAVVVIALVMWLLGGPHATHC